MDRGFASIMFIPYLSHLLRHTSIGFWDHRGLLDIMVVWVRSRGIRICCFCVSFGFIEFLEFFGVFFFFFFFFFLYHVFVVKVQEPV